MYAVERRQWLVDRARSNGRLDVTALSEELNLAPETIRRDLNDLERQGMLRRVYGGAVPIERLHFESALSVRASRRPAEKCRILKAQLGSDAGVIGAARCARQLWLSRQEPHG